MGGASGESGSRPVVFAGGWIPAPITYGPLISALGAEVRPVLTVMQAFLGDRLPDGYGISTEAAVIAAAADAAGADRFDLVGFSGGASAALAFAAVQPGRVRSLVLAEPAWIGMGCGATDTAFLAAFDEILTLPADELLPAFQRALLAPGVTPPPLPPGLTPELVEFVTGRMRAAWPALRPATLDVARLADLSAPVYLPVGGRSTARMGEVAQALAGVFSDAEVEVLAERHHFDLMEAEPDRLADGLRRLWARSSPARLTTTHSA
jgi:pimeloyl-ACP methyl ester carboxylesterase